MAIRVRLIDDQMLVREGIRGLLGLSEKVEVVAEAADGKEAVELARAHAPDVILMDMCMPGLDGAAATRELHDRGYDIPVIRLMAGGYSNREIAEALSKSEGTIKNHVSNILAKLGVRDRTRAVLKAIEAGML